MFSAGILFNLLFSNAPTHKLSGGLFYMVFMKCIQYIEQHYLFSFHGYDA